MTFTILGMSGNRDWIAIYPAGTSNDWDNVIAWKWTKNIINGKITFSSIDSGEYEARVFFHNSFKSEATVAFSVAGHYQNTTITTQKDRYKQVNPSP